ncbi:TPA: hypothetical protein ACFK4W_01615 [Neisseria gonorrhoeae]
MPACREFLRHCRFDGQCLRRNSEHQGIRPMPNLVTAVLARRFLRWRIPYPTHQTDNISSRILTARICWYESSAQAEKAVAPKTVARINCLNFMMLLLLHKAFGIVKPAAYGFAAVAALQAVLQETLKHDHCIKSCSNSAK